MNNKITIIAPNLSTFVVRDTSILFPEYDVTVIKIPSLSNKFMIPFDTYKMIINIIKSKVIISWFADWSYYPTLIAKFFNKKIFIIVGGVDVAHIKEINYGSLLIPKKKKQIKYVFENATKIITVDEGLINDIKKHFNNDFNATVIPTGYNSLLYKSNGEKDNFILSVCSANNKTGLVKGIDIFTKCARRMKDLQFVLIGVEGEAIKLLGDIPDNLTLVGKVQSYDIIKYYQKAKVYCQLSMREGLPNALCEAMLCECVPVGTNVQGITTVMENNGILVDYGNIEQTCIAIRKALTMDGKECRKYIIENFSESKRKELLIKLIEEGI